MSFIQVGFGVKKQGYVSLVLAIASFLLISANTAWSMHSSAPVDEYMIHDDGGLVCDPLRREATKTGQLRRYLNTKVRKDTLVNGPYRLEVNVPDKATAYDVIPVHYSLSWKKGAAFPVGVEAVGFEDAERRGGRDLHDLALPDQIDLGIEYLGSITAHLVPELKHNLEADFSDTPKEYPNFRREPLVRSGVVESGDLVWFKFRYTNTGNTILDSEGFGGCQFYPELLRKNEDGKYKPYAKPYNLYYRLEDYLYPGESKDVWINFQTRAEGEPAEYYRLVPGEYKIQLKLTHRSYKTPDPYLNNWDGPVAFTWEMPITVADKAKQSPVETGKKLVSPTGDEDKLTRFIHTFEEFMTSFDCHLTEPKNDLRRIEGTLYLQVAPWTEHVVVKLIGTGPVSIVSKPIPINVDSDSLKVKYNSNAKYSLVRNGLREPMFMSQTMADMRTNVQHSPFSEHHIRNRLREMMDCGINVTATTSMPWMYADIKKPIHNYPGDAWKYYLDVAREEGMLVEGWGQYPFDRGTIQKIAGWITGKNYKDMTMVTSGYADNALYVSHLEPRLPAANADILLYHFYRWGDLFYQSENGSVPVSVGEDTRGWMRSDINVRYPVGEIGTKAFRVWLKNKYKTIETVNSAWGSRFKDFDSIDPETKVVDRFGLRWNYLGQDHPFHDWNHAVEDFDIWRTEVRVQNYRDTLKEVAKKIPHPSVVLRTEGSNVLVGGLDPENSNAHYRHAYYSQRRCGAIAEVIAASGQVAIHSDYTTIPYTPSELRKLVRMAVKQGVVPAYLPYFNDMRDIAINDRYGTDYQIIYNLPEPKKGYMTHELVACYPWFQVMVEEGGVPGILWDDYQCVGFVTETQKREMRFFQSKLREAMNTSEVLKARAKEIHRPDQTWRKESRAIRSYYGLEQK